MLASCASTPSEPVSYDPATQARIRVFHAGRSYITLGHVCEPGKKESIHAAAGGYSFMVPNKVIGIPRTDDMRSFSYHEYVIPAGQTVTVEHYWSDPTSYGPGRSCGPYYYAFEPLAGTDYDTSILFKGGFCMGIEVRRLVPTDDGKIITYPARPVPNGLFSRCPRR